VLEGEGGGGGGRGGPRLLQRLDTVPKERDHWDLNPGPIGSKDNCSTTELLGINKDNNIKVEIEATTRTKMKRDNKTE
jgi:hypothetical protein